MTDTFTWKPRVGALGQTDLRTRKAQFGDGYSQEAGDGINNAAQTWQLSFTKKSAGMQPIVDFLKSHKGYQSFYWTPPMGTQGLYRVNQYTISPHGADAYTLNVSFKECFQP